MGDQTKSERLVIEESPGARSRKVVGPKKLAQITIKVEEPKEIEKGAFDDTMVQGLFENNK